MKRGFLLSLKKNFFRVRNTPTLSLTPEDYQEAVDWLFVQMPNYQIDGQKAYKPV